MSAVYFEMDKKIRSGDGCKEGRRTGDTCDNTRILMFMVKSR